MTGLDLAGAEDLSRACEPCLKEKDDCYRYTRSRGSATIDGRQRDRACTWGNKIANADCEAAGVRNRKVSET
jgi:hypothetical protein